MTRKHTIIVDHCNVKKRLDVLVASVVGTSRNKAQHMIEQGRVEFHGMPVCDNSHITKVGNVYVVTVSDDKNDTECSTYPNYNIPLKIVYEDSHIIVIDKPPNLPTHYGSGTKNITVANALVAHCGNSICSVGSSRRPGIVHRLDKDTSGLMVATKTQEAFFTLSKAFEERKVAKEYTALIWGIPHKKHGLVETNLDVKKSDRTMMEVTYNRGKSACTEYHVEETLGTVASLVKCILHTGRTHQIRVHMSHIGHSIIGDQKYGKNTKKSLGCSSIHARNFGRQALHASLLKFNHPESNKQLCFLSEPGEDIQNLISALLYHTP
ncbi:MAG: RluA family pseudouridine synthase [Aaplasma endosymbiont of Hyalomma asiaticum]